MNKVFRRSLIAFGVVSALVLIPVSLAWACLGIAGLTINPAVAQPGQSVSVTLTEFGSTPAQVHLDSVNGPILATVNKPGAGMSGRTTVMMTIPADITPGTHVLIATEPGNGMLAGIPARAVLQVGNSAPAAASPGARAATVTTASSGLSGITIGLIVLGVAAVAIFLGGAISLMTARRRPQAETVKIS